MKDLKPFSKSKRLFFLTVPLLIYLGFFYAFPMLLMVHRSFFDPDITMRHYLGFFNFPAYVTILMNTYSVAFSVTILCLVFGYPLAYLLTVVSNKTRQVLTVLIIIPFWISLLVRTYAWMVLLGRNGILNQLFLNLGIADKPVMLMYNRIGVYVGMLNVLLPFMILPLHSVMKSIDRNLVKSAQILGAAPWKAFVKVFLPLSLPGVAGGGLLVFIIAIGFFITPALLGGPKDIMISMLIQTQIEQNFDWGFASSIASILLVTTLIVLGFYNRFFGIDKFAER